MIDQELLGKSRTMRYRVRYERPDGYYSAVEVSAMDIGQAQRRAEEYLNGACIPYTRIDQVYEVGDE